MITPTKAELRRELLAARRSKTVEDNELVRAAVHAYLATRSDTIVAAFHPLPNEPGGALLLPLLRSLVATVLLPIVLPDRDLDWAVPMGLAAGPMGLTEPTGPRLGPSAIRRASVVLVPALAVDRSGNRLGRGGGSYDRALARVDPTQTVLALLYPGELLDSVPSEPHDRPVDGVVIDGRVEFFRKL